MTEHTKKALQDMALSQKLIVEGRDVSWMLDQWANSTPEKTFLIWEPFEGSPKNWTYA
ncbi:MAG: hypothetical protein JKY34_15850 [Kordiimonadaceae bacterium]|nr:hypothetical protein [Kordiimonadaceae bacterium]